MTSNSPDPDGEVRNILDQEAELHFLKEKFHAEFTGVRSNELETAIAAAKQMRTEPSQLEAKVREILTEATQ